MKNTLFAFVSLALLFASCVEETPRAELLEYYLGGKQYSYKGYAYRYIDYIDNKSKAYDWHIFNHGQAALYIQAYDSSYVKTIFPWPLFDAMLTVELPDGKSKIYTATGGEFRITGQEMGDVIGDFHVKVKNIADPLDSIMITQGFYRIWLESYKRYFSK